MTMPPRMLRAGDLRDRLVIETPTVTSDGSGGTTTTWASLASVWGKVVLLRGADVLVAEQTVPKRQYDVTIRKRTDVAQQMRVARGAQRLAILAVNDDTEHLDALVLTCEEVVLP